MTAVLVHYSEVALKGKNRCSVGHQAIMACADTGNVATKDRPGFHRMHLPRLMSDKVVTVPGSPMSYQRNR